MTYSLYILSSVQSGSIRILESCMALLSWAYPRTIGVPWIVFRGALVWLSSMAVALARPENPSILCCKGDGNIIYKISFFGFSFLLSRPRIDLSYPKFSFSHRRNVVRLSARYHDTLEQILVGGLFSRFFTHDYVLITSSPVRFSRTIFFWRCSTRRCLAGLALTIEDLLHHLLGCTLTRETLKLRLLLLRIAEGRDCCTTNTHSQFQELQYFHHTAGQIVNKVSSIIQLRFDFLKIQPTRIL